MKYLTYTLAILCLGISTSWAFPDFTFPDFRLSKWGDTKEQVLAVEPGPLTALDDDPDTLVWHCPLYWTRTFFSLIRFQRGESSLQADYLLFRTLAMSPQKTIRTLFNRIAKPDLIEIHHGPRTAVRPSIPASSRIRCHLDNAGNTHMARL